MGAPAVSGLRPMCTLVTGVDVMRASPLPSSNRCLPARVYVLLYACQRVHPPVLLLEGAGHLQCSGYAPLPVGPRYWIHLCYQGVPSGTSIPRGLSISSVFFSGLSNVQIPMVSHMGVACLRRVAVVVAGGRPKPPLRELSPFLTALCEAVWGTED